MSGGEDGGERPPGRGEDPLDQGEARSATVPAEGEGAKQFAGLWTKAAARLRRSSNLRPLLSASSKRSCAMQASFSARAWATEMPLGGSWSTEVATARGARWADDSSRRKRRRFSSRSASREATARRSSRTSSSRQSRCAGRGSGAAAGSQACDSSSGGGAEGVEAESSREGGQRRGGLRGPASRRATTCRSRADWSRDSRKVRFARSDTSAATTEAECGAARAEQPARMRS